VDNLVSVFLFVLVTHLEQETNRETGQRMPDFRRGIHR